MSKTRQKCSKNLKTPNNTTTLFSEHLMMAEACIPNENNGFVHEMFIMIMITPLIIIMVNHDYYGVKKSCNRDFNFADCDAIDAHILTWQQGHTYQDHDF